MSGGRLVAAAAFLGLLGGDDPDPEQEGYRLFEAMIRPVLVAECYRCHSAEARPPKAGFRLDERDRLLEGGDSGPAVVPGKPAESLLIHVLDHSSEIAMMPPGKRLPDTVLDDFRRWVKLGAPYASRKD